MNCTPSLNRRDFLAATGTVAVAGSSLATASPSKPARKPNVLYLFSDQWRASDHGYAGNREVRTPNIDKLADQSVNFTHAVAGIPVCCPARASLITGQYPLTHGLYLNDLSLNPDNTSIADCFNASGYETGWIGKWHLDGQGRLENTPVERRQGFKFWRALECSHNYNNSFYYGDTGERKLWSGYDAFPQTRTAQDFLKTRGQDEKPFALFLSWGPPHAPYHTAPDKYKDMYAGKKPTLHPNVPESHQQKALRDYRGYYAHMTALDDCVGNLMKTLDETGLAEDTIVVYTSDHGDMLYSHGNVKKQQPWDESLRVPFLMRHPRKLGKTARKIDLPIDTPDIMPTLLSLCDVEVPETVEGRDFSGVISGKEKNFENVALITCPSPFGQWRRAVGGKEYRGIRTTRYTYCRDLKGPWLMYDNEKDTYQQTNLVERREHGALRKELDRILNKRLRETRDDFLSGPDLIRRSGYVIGRNETVDYNIPFNPKNKTKSPLKA
jgi:arylsulfatase A-like enzyme